MVLSIWAVTPLQSGIFNVALTTMVHHISISPPARLPPLSQQRNVLGGNLLNAAYGVPWLEQALPPFTTREFSLAPFSWHALESAGKNASLVANTTLYRSELSCSAPASVKPAAGEPSGVFEVDDGQGCKQKTRTSAPTNGFQIQACNKYFIVWHDERADVSNVSRVVTRFCQTAYYSQPVQANVSLPDGTVIQTWPLGPQSALAGHEFNSSLFEYIVNIGLAPGIGKNATNLHEKTPRPYPVAEDTVLSQTLRLSQHGFPHVNSIMGGLALGQQNLPFDRFIQSPEAIDSAYNSAQQLLFALAVSSVSKPFAVSGASHPAIHTFSIQSVQLVSAFTRSVQLCLGLIVILTTVLAFWYYNKFLPFGSDPNSIGFLAALASRHKFLEYFKSLDREEDFVPRLRHRQATLRSRDGPLSLSLDNADHGSDIYDSTETNGLAECRAKKGMQYRVQNTWPTELKLPAGLAFALTLFLLIATLLFLDTWTRSHRGLPLPSENTIARQIILNFIPTVFGTVIEPFLIVVCRYLCFLQPFEDLRRGSAKTTKALLEKYTSLPPQLAFVTAIRHRHFRLASLSIAIILTNALTVALSTVFVIREAILSTEVDAVQLYSPTLNQSNIDYYTFEVVGGWAPGTNGEPFQYLLSNITVGTPLPPWTTKDRYYLPVNLTSAQEDSSNYELTTLGFEGSVDCTVLTESPSNFTYEFSLNSEATQIRYLTAQTFPNGTTVNCFAPMAFTDDTITLADGNHPTTQIFISGNPAGQSAAEMFMVPMPGPSVFDRQHRLACSEHFLGGWVRANISLSNQFSVVNGPASTENIGLTTSPTANTTSVALEKLFLACEPRTHAAKYNVTVDSDYQILNAVELPNSSFLMHKTVSDGAFDQIRQPLRYPSDLLTWHNDTLAREWMSFFVSKLAQSDSLLDPAAPLPDSAELGRRISDVMRRLFALVLAINRDAFVEASEPVNVPCQKLTVVNRVFLSDVMYKIALVILGIDLVVVLNIYLRMPKPFLPRMPTSIASNVAFFAASRFAQELAEMADTCATPEELIRYLKDRDRKIGFGRFIGTDGRAHIGIERAPFVQPLDDVEGFRRRSKWKFRPA